MQKEKGIRCSIEPSVFTINYQLQLWVAQTSGHDASALHTCRNHRGPGATRHMHGKAANACAMD